MELRTVESEITNLASLYNDLRHASSKQDDSSPSLPSLEELIPVTEPDNNKNDKPESSSNNDDDKQPSAESITDDSSIKEMNHREILDSLDSLSEKVKELQPRADRFRQRLKEKDPITGASRYGEKTTRRVTTLLQTYDALTLAVETAFVDCGVADSLRRSLQREAEACKRERLRIERHAEWTEAERQEEEARRIESEEREKRREAERRQKEAAELAARAEAARRARMEEKQRAEEERQRAKEAERRADCEFMDSIPKGLSGVKTQLDVLRKGCADDPSAREAAIGALHAVFGQIVAHPEDIQFRKIRRDHPKFLKDIGRHPGGKEILIAAGFRLETLEGVSCFFTREPDVEKDMEAWSDWFDLLKGTLELIEEERRK